MSSNKIGRFQCHTPAIDTRELVGSILRQAKQHSKHTNVFCTGKSHELHLFFKQAKDKYPEIFQDVWFTNDPMFPYSIQISEAISTLPQVTKSSLAVSPSLHKYTLPISDLGKQFAEQFLARHKPKR